MQGVLLAGLSLLAGCLPFEDHSEYRAKGQIVAATGGAPVEGVAVTVSQYLSTYELDRPPEKSVGIVSADAEGRYECTWGYVHGMLASSRKWDRLYVYVWRDGMWRYCPVRVDPSSYRRVNHEWVVPIPPVSIADLLPVPPIDHKTR